MYWHVIFVVSGVSTLHTGLQFLETSLFANTIDRAKLPRSPLFIIGHWRTGTTLLHELLTLDERHTYPNTYCCLAPNHFLLTEKFLKRFFRWMLPSHRPMDAMKVSWDKPQEDEFALCMLGQPSPYLTCAFPNHPPQDPKAVDLEELPRKDREGWKQAFLRFLKRLTLRDPRRLILKSPTHTCRIPTILELFPDAQFLHIVRDPYVVFPSTINLWRSLWQAHTLQNPHFRGIEEYVFSTFEHLYERLDATRHLVPKENWFELRYEDLIAHPIEKMREVYQTLNLGSFEKTLPNIENYLRENADYKTNRYPQLSPELREQIRQRWGAVIQRYGYGQ
jgi:hypothetical protein